MSFVYAELLDETFEIYCDTKITLSECAGLSCSTEQLHAISQFGIVKTTILCPEISVSYAGNDISLAAKLFSMMAKKGSFTTDDVIDTAYKLHKEVDLDAIEFIIASCENEQLSLHCIKQNEIHRNIKTAWIGSGKAFNIFQRERLARSKECVSETTRTAFQDTVYGGDDESVGGFVVEAGFSQNEKCLLFKNVYVFCSSKNQLVKPGETIRFYMEVKDGGYSYEQIPITLLDVIIRVDQMDYALLYSRRYRMNSRDSEEQRLFSLMLPMKVKMDETGDSLQCICVL